MKGLSSAVLFFSLALLCSLSASGANKKNDPGQFPLAVHISASAYIPSLDYSSRAVLWNEVVTATIDGRHYQLFGPTSDPHIEACCNGLINPGDYRAKLTKDEHATSYESRQTFEILFPDGSTRPFQVIAQSE
jgi:hypothetical protein